MVGFSLNSKNKNSIKESVDNLIEAGMIEVYADFLGTVVVDCIQLSKTYFVRVNDEKPSQYTRIYMKEAYKIMTLDDKNKAKMFVVFMEIVSYIYVNEKSPHYCFPNIETLEECTGVNRKTIMKYVQQLHENEILYHQTYKKGKGKDKNVYSRWDDKQHAIDYITSELNN
ncbi:helix-turn-helix domain-containing protein [Bacillus gaemokensis]|nr:helix-turn-helix domain-containing protein [Bacillus gaemokensis]